jgi:predicted transcriptional regulator
VNRQEMFEQFRQVALTAWREFQATGLHATYEEVDVWLARLEAGEKAEAPECHT